MKKNGILTIVILVILVALIGYVVYGYIQKAVYKPQNPIATIEMEDGGIIEIELYPDMAPNTVTNFIKLANDGFYNGLTFHRTIPDFMIQGGDPNGNGSGGPEYGIPGEFAVNGYRANSLLHKKGVISMARSDYSSIAQELAVEGYNSAGSQFFIMTEDNASLDGMYAAFGEVKTGMEIVEKIANVEVVTRDAEATEGLDKPVNPPVIKSITINTFGVNYGTPKTLTPFDYNSWLMQNYGSMMSGDGMTIE